MKAKCKSVFSFFLLSILIIGCTPKVYTVSNFAEVTKAHKTIAILPAWVEIQLRPSDMKNTTPEKLKEIEKETSFFMQEKLYGWFLKRKDWYKYTVTFQDFNKTNEILNKAKINNTDLQKITKAELCKLLEVDVVFSSTAIMKKPMSEGAAIALGLLLRSWNATNTVTVTLNINAALNSELLWKYDWEASGTVTSDPDRLVNSLLRNASRHFPYNTTKL